MIKLRLSSLLFVIIVFFFHLSLSFSLSCTNDFSNTEFYTESGDTAFQLGSENSINVINNNLSSHSLTIYMEKTANESGCYALEDFSILEQANTQTIADQFDEQSGENGNTNYIWTFQLPQTSLITQQYVERQFIHSQTHTSSNPVNHFLSMKVDRNAPSITSLNLKKDSQSLQTNPNNQNSQGLSSNDQVELEVRGSDDIFVNNVSILSIQGGQVVNSSIQSISEQQKLLNAQINLTQSPLSVNVRATDEFDKTRDETIEVFFDAQAPSVESMQITSYELTNSLDYKIVGEVVTEDDFSLNPSLLTGHMSTPNGETVDLTIRGDTCEDISGDGNSNSLMRCEFSSQVVEIDSTYTADFTFELQDGVGNTIEESFSEQVSIDTNSPQILKFEVRNVLNNTNSISPHVEESSRILLRVSNPEPELYENVVFSESSTPESKIRIEESFAELGDDLTKVCEALDATTVECSWEIPQNRVPNVNSFNISLSVIDIAGNSVEEEIEVTVDNTIPSIEKLELQERDNERNEVFESSERARIEIILEDAKEQEDIGVDITKSAVLFEDPIESISFECYFDNEIDTQVCFTDTFNLNNGFDGNRSEPLEVEVYDNSGNKANSSIDVKIYKVEDNESIDYYEFEDSRILSPINRRLIKEQGLDVYHKFNIKPKNNNEEFKILQIELLGLASSGENEGEEVRLNQFELQNQTSLGVVRGDRREYFLKSFMPQLLSVKETEDDTKAQINVSIVKVDEDTIYRGETLVVDLPVEFYDMPRDLDSNIATVEKLLSDIEGVSEERKNKQSILDMYMTYYDLCEAYNSISAIIHSVSNAWFLISIAIGWAAPTEPGDEAVGRTSKANSLMGNIDDVIGKVCMLSTCDYSQELLGGALDSATNTEFSSYLTGKKSFLGNAVCSPGGIDSSSEE